MKKDKEKSDVIYFKNEGKVQTKVELKTTEMPEFKIEPSSFFIQPGSEMSVKIKYTPTDAGIFRGTIEVITEA